MSESQHRLAPWSAEAASRRFVACTANISGGGALWTAFVLGAALGSGEERTQS